MLYRRSSKLISSVCKKLANILKIELKLNFDIRKESTYSKRIADALKTDVQIYLRLEP